MLFFILARFLLHSQGLWPWGLRDIFFISLRQVIVIYWQKMTIFQDLIQCPVFASTQYFMQNTITMNNHMKKFKLQREFHSDFFKSCFKYVKRSFDAHSYSRVFPIESNLFFWKRQPHRCHLVLCNAST